MIKTILVVDDTADNLSLILLDIMMPELSGYDVIKVLKKGTKTKDIPVIFLTASIDARDEEKGFEMGAADYITKPILASIMLSRIKTQLENKEAKDFLKHQNEFLSIANRYIDNDSVIEQKKEQIGEIL